MDALLLDLLHHRGIVRDARTLHHFVGIQDFILAMASLLERNVPFLQVIGVMVGYLAIVGKENVESFHLCKHGGTDSALSAT